MVLNTATTSHNSNLLKPPLGKKVSEKNATDQEFSEPNNSATSGDTRSHQNNEGRVRKGKQKTDNIALHISASRLVSSQLDRKTSLTSAENLDSGD